MAWYLNIEKFLTFSVINNRNASALSLWWRWPAVLCVLVFMPIVGFSTNIDSLIELSKKVEGIQKAKILNDLCWELKFKDQIKSIEYGLEGLNLAQTLGDKESEADLLKNLGVAHHLKGEYEQAKVYSNRAIDLYKKADDVKGIADARNILGLSETSLGSFDEALLEFEKAILLYEALGETSRVVTVEANVANIYYRKGNFNEAEPYYHRIVDQARKEGDIEKLETNLYNLGIVHVKLGDYPKALTFLFESSNLSKEAGNTLHWIKSQNEIGLVYRRLDLKQEAIELYIAALKNAEKLDNQNLVASIANNLGLCYLRTGQLKKSLVHFERSLEIRDSLNISNVGHILNNIGSVHYEMQNFELAMDYYNRALTINSDLDIKHMMAIDLSDIGLLHADMGEDEKAERFLLNAFNLFKESGEMKSLENNTRVLELLYRKKGAVAEADRFRRLNAAYSDSLFNIQEMIASNRVIIQQHLKERKAEQMEAHSEITQLQEENKQQKERGKEMTFLIGGIFFVMIAAAAYYVRKFRINKKKLSHRLAKEEKENHVLESTIQEQNRDMILFSLDMIQKESLMKSFKSRLSELQINHPDKPELRSLLNQFELNKVITKDWEFFNKAFNKTFPGFTENLKEKFPNLSNKELQHCLLIKLNTPPNQAANILGITTESVHTARYRLRKKMNLERQDSLENLILSL